MAKKPTKSHSSHKKCSKGSQNDNEGSWLTEKSSNILSGEEIESLFTKKYCEDVGGTSFWIPRKEALLLAPQAPGIFVFGVRKKGGVVHSSVETVYIGQTGENNTLRECLLNTLFGFDGSPSDRLSMFLCSPENESRVVVQWTYSICPGELIEDRMEEFIALNHYIPTFNTPLDPNKGLWVLEDDDSQDSML